jgi:hypothetical protein
VQSIFISKKGFTLTELILGSLFALVVIGSLYGFYREQLFQLLTQETKTATLEESRGTLDFMIRDIRNAGAWSAGNVPVGCTRITEATATRIHIQADLDGNGDCSSLTGEDVLYTLTGATSTCPGTTIRRNGDCLASNVVVPPGNDFLSYYRKGANTPLTHPIVDLSLVQRVKITFAVQVNNPHPNAKGTVESVLSSSVDLRN